MNIELTIAISLLIEKLATIFSGLFLCYLGYRLSKSEEETPTLKADNNSGFEVSFPHVVFKALNLDRGKFFSFTGCLLILFSASKDIQYKTSTNYNNDNIQSIRKGNIATTVTTELRGANDAPHTEGTTYLVKLLNREKRIYSISGNSKAVSLIDRLNFTFSKDYFSDDKIKSYNEIKHCKYTQKREDCSLDKSKYDDFVEVELWLNSE